MAARRPEVIQVRMVLGARGVRVPALVEAELTELGLERRPMRRVVFDQLALILSVRALQLLEECSMLRQPRGTPPLCTGSRSSELTVGRWGRRPRCCRC